MVSALCTEAGVPFNDNVASILFGQTSDPTSPLGWWSRATVGALRQPRFTTRRTHEKNVAALNAQAEAIGRENRQWEARWGTFVPQQRAQYLQLIYMLYGKGTLSSSSLHRFS